jgi:hypothetical protein
MGSREMTTSLNTHGTAPGASILKDKQRALRQGFSPALALRVHRAISWLTRANVEKNDDDLRFMLLWVGFNSAYASEIGFEDGGERGVFSAFFDRLVAFDVNHRIYNAVWERFPHEIRVLLNNKYVFAPFWSHQNGYPGYADWDARLARSQQKIASAMGKRDTSTILSVVFDRLYVLRNQLVHGGATWNSSVNRRQVHDGASVLGWPLPIFIDIMMDNPNHDWGTPFYPVVD